MSNLASLGDASSGSQEGDLASFKEVEQKKKAWTEIGGKIKSLGFFLCGEEFQKLECSVNYNASLSIARERVWRLKGNDCSRS